MITKNTTTKKWMLIINIYIYMHLYTYIYILIYTYIYIDIHIKQIRKTNKTPIKDLLKTYIKRI